MSGRVRWMISATLAACGSSGVDRASSSSPSAVRLSEALNVATGTRPEEAATAPRLLAGNRRCGSVVGRRRPGGVVPEMASSSSWSVGTVSWSSPRRLVVSAGRRVGRRRRGRVVVVSSAPDVDDDGCRCQYLDSESMSASSSYVNWSWPTYPGQGRSRSHPQRWSATWP